MRNICIILLAGCVGACGNENGQALTEDASRAQEIAAADGPRAVSAGDIAGSEAQPGKEESPSADAAATGPSVASSAAQSGPAATLPLPLGFYVSTDIDCSQASNATLQLLRRDGINTSRVPCDFESVVKTGATTYRVTETCTEGGEAWGTEEQVSTTTSTYEILSGTSFKAVSDDGWENSMKHCPQALLPEPWRDNDISDIIG